MKGNKINGILWIIISLFLLGILIRGLSGKDYRNMKFWTWHISSENGSDGKGMHYDVESENGENGFITYSFDSEKIENLDLNAISSDIKCFTSGKSDKILIKISDNINVKKLYEIKTEGSTLVLKRKPKIKIWFENDAKEIIIILPDTLFESIELNAVSGNINAKELSARKIEVSTVSGRIEAEDLQGKLIFNTVSGRIDFSTKNLKNNLDAESVSGKIEIKLPPDADFTADYETVSGSVTSDFEKTGKKDGLITNGDRTYDLRLETVSGSINVNSL